jgi:DMSO/TMAO reductase YedYZ molybdopterin-dependent catalytic subunit
VRDLLTAVAGDDAHSIDHVVVVSMQTHGDYRTSRLTRAWLDDAHTLLAYDLEGAPLAADHGAPLRVIAPNRPGVLQTKWVHRLELS